jgi:hypothetical protein
MFGKGSEALQAFAGWYNFVVSFASGESVPMTEHLSQRR